MEGKILVSTAYLPPIEYFSLISKADEVIIEREENYIKQSYRNRCYVLSARGRQPLSVPVYLGSQHKTPVKDIRIDYSKRWQQIHLRTLTASYNSSPYFEYYFEIVEKVISAKNDFLLDLNTDLLKSISGILKINTKFTFSTTFAPPGEADNDFRYIISPKIESPFSPEEYLQVFSVGRGFVGGLSILDLIFNMGPEAVDYL